MHPADLLPIVALVPVIVALVQVLKSSLNLGSRVLPLVNLLVALVLAAVWAVAGGDVASSQDAARLLLQALVTGLAAGGAYDGLRPLLSQEAGGS